MASFSKPQPIRGVTDAKSFESFQASTQKNNQNALRRVQRALRQIENLTLQGIKDVINIVGDESQKQVPVSADGSHGGQPGDLKKSMFTKFKQEKNRIIGTIGYGKNGEAAYGVFVHERMDQKHDFPTKSKFLEDPLKAVAKQVPRIIAGAIRLK